MEAISEITVNELKKLKENNADFFLLDVRRPNEFTEFNINGHLIPLDELDDRLNEIPKNKPIIIHCRSGVRSASAVRLLLANNFSDVKNLAGGILAWQDLST